jgi:hypothetical protein
MSERIDSLKESTGKLMAALDKLGNLPDSERFIKLKSQSKNYRFWRVVVPGVEGTAEEFFAASLADAFKLARIRWPLAGNFKCVGSRV